MNLLVERDTFTALSTTGKMYINGKFVCYTLEPVWLDMPTDVKPRAIPEGVYKVIIAYSPKHKRDVPLYEGIDGFEEVEIHIGNYPKDTLGCQLVGLDRQADSVLHSTEAFINVVFPVLNQAFQSGDRITSSVVNLKV